jgi:hypothetical protein
MNRSASPWRPRVVATLAGLCLLGCSATIHRRDESVLHAKILRSDSNQLWHEDARGAEVSLPCREIKDIQHPGALSLFLGAALGLGSAIAYATEEKRTCTECGPNVSGSAVLLVLAVPLVVAGGLAWLRSHGAALRCQDGAQPPR